MFARTEMANAGLIDEIMGDAIDSVMDGEDMEEEMDEQINQVKLRDLCPM